MSCLVYGLLVITTYSDCPITFLHRNNWSCLSNPLAHKHPLQLNDPTLYQFRLECTGRALQNRGFASSFKLIWTSVPFTVPNSSLNTAEYVSRIVFNSTLSFFSPNLNSLNICFQFKRMLCNQFHTSKDGPDPGVTITVNTFP